jgi:hypothetical protein
MTRPRHPDKHIEKVVDYAESLGWTFKISSGHAWGRIYCPMHNRDGCIWSVWSTPKNPEKFALKLRRLIDQCSHDPTPDESES